MKLPLYLRVLLTLLSSAATAPTNFNSSHPFTNLVVEVTRLCILNRDSPSSVRPL